MVKKPVAKKKASPKNGNGSGVSLLEYRLRDTASLYPNPRNARQHSDEQIASILRSIKRFGWPNPIVAMRDGRIIAGEGRWRAALLGELAQVPTLTAPKGWKIADVIAYGIADNQLSDSSEWNDEVLRDELRALSSNEYDLSPIGFTDDELRDLLAVEGGPQAPGDFRSFDESIETEHQCPACGYQWSGGQPVAKSDEAPGRGSERPSERKQAAKENRRRPSVS